MQYKKLWIALGLVMFVSFTVLGVVGYKGIKNGPPTPEQSRHRRRARTVHRRDDSQRTKRVAVDRRPGDRHHLGSRRLRRSRLERRLSASAVGNRSRSLGAAAGICQLCRHAGGIAGGPAGPAHRSDAPQYV